MTAFGSDLILARLMQLHPKKIDLSLERIDRLLAALGRPEQQLPPVVHIAGTNGKGSTLAMLDAMLTAAGKRTHRYISPHLVRFNERILIHGLPIAEDHLAVCLDACEQANAGEPITFFEITTAAAIMAFNEVPADYILLETGLGGRVDATNICTRPALTLITPVSMDHEAFLGDTIAKIAFEKAGIIKPGVPVFLAPQHDDALAVMRERARELQAPVQAAGRDWQVIPQDDGFALECQGRRTQHPAPWLAGRHQLDNAGLAITAARFLSVGEVAINQGLRTTRWPARLQPIQTGSLVKKLRPGQDIWLDGGHNPAAGQALAASIDEIAQGRPVDMILGMLTTKDVGAFLAPLASHIERLVAVAVPDEPASRGPAETAELAEEMGYEASSSLSIEQAVNVLALSRPSPRLILICGSLYLAGHVLKTIDGAGPDHFNIKG